jgi:hypothetical protein
MFLFLHICEVCAIVKVRPSICPCFCFCTSAKFVLSPKFGLPAARVSVSAHVQSIRAEIASVMLFSAGLRAIMAYPDLLSKELARIFKIVQRFMDGKYEDHPRMANRHGLVGLVTQQAAFVLEKGWRMHVSNKVGCWDIENFTTDLGKACDVRMQSKAEKFWRDKKEEKENAVEGTFYDSSHLVAGFNLEQRLYGSVEPDDAEEAYLSQRQPGPPTNIPRPSVRFCS